MGEEAQRAARELELRAAAPPLVEHLDDARMEGIRLTQQVFVAGLARGGREQVAPGLAAVELGVSRRRVRRCRLIHLLEQPGADDGVDFGAFDGRAGIFDAAQDVLQLGKRELRVLGGEYLQVLHLAHRERGHQDAVRDGVHRLGQFANESQGLRSQVGIAHLDRRRFVHVVQEFVDEDDVRAGFGEQLAQFRHAGRAAAGVAVRDDSVEFTGALLPAQAIGQLAPQVWW